MKLHIILLTCILPAIANAQQPDSDTLKKPIILLVDTNGSNTIPEFDYGIFTGKKRSDAFYDSLENIAGSKNWSKELYKLIISAPPEYNPGKSLNESDRVKHFAQHENKVIRSIKITRLDVFGPTITDTSRPVSHWIERTGNSLHVVTNKRFIENNLFFDQGERIDPYIIADNERILRNIPSIQDVRIYITPVDGEPDSVDVQIVTKDVMAYGFSWEIFDVSYGQASIWNTNMLGLGHRFGYTAYYNLNREPKYGYNINYKLNNIGNSFTSLELLHTNKNDILTSAVQVERRFISPIIRFGGGLGFGRVKKYFTLETIDTSIADVVSDYGFYDIWGGYSFPFRTYTASKIRKAYFFTLRNELYNFYERPEVSENYLYDFYTRNITLGSIGVTWQGYHTTRLVYGFGDTEDIPYGAMVKFTGGYEQHEFNYREYYALTLTYAKSFNKLGYLSNTVSVGGFYRDDVEQGTLKNNLLYFTPLFGNKRHQFRNFFRADYIRGINRFNDEFTLIEDRNGVRGIHDKLLKGNERFFLNNELVYYSPQYLYGFRFVYYFFADGGIINHNNSSLFNNPMYISSGIGVRIRNERLVFNTIQLQFTFFPLAPGLENSQTQYFDFRSFPEYRMPEFANRRPEVIDFYTR